MFAHVIENYIFFWVLLLSTIFVLNLDIKIKRNLSIRKINIKIV